MSFKLIFININIELKQQLLNSARKSIEKAGMMTTSEKVYEPFWKVAKLLLACKGENKMVKNETVIKLINDKKISLLLRNSNAFSYTDCAGNAQSGGGEPGFICLDINQSYSVNIDIIGDSAGCQCS